MQQRTRSTNTSPVVIRKKDLPAFKNNSSKPYTPPKSGVTPREGHSYLCLTRSTNEAKNRIIIGDIEIELVSIRGRQARIGIYAPKETPIHRAENPSDE